MKSYIQLRAATAWLDTAELIRKKDQFGVRRVIDFKTNVTFYETRELAESAFELLISDHLYEELSDKYVLTGDTSVYKAVDVPELLDHYRPLPDGTAEIFTEAA